HMVDRTGGGTAGGDDHLRVARGDRLVQRRFVVAHPAYVGDRRPQCAQPGREPRTEGVPGESVVRQSLAEQLVAEDEHGGTGAGDGHERVVSGGGGHPQDGRGDQGAHGQQLVAAAALLSAGADVLAGGDGVRCPFGGGDVQPALGVGAAAFAAQHRGGVRGDTGTGGDADGVAVGARRVLGAPGEDAFGPCGPGAGAGDGPAVRRGGVGGGQVGEGVEGGGQGEAEGGGAGDGHRGQVAGAAAGAGTRGAFGGGT